MVGFIICVVWLFLAIRAVFVLFYLICSGIKLLFSSHREPQPGEFEFRRRLVEQAERTRLTRSERARRYFALYPVPEVPRARWPTSHQR